MLRKLVLLSSLLFTSLSAQATLISHFGYERDSASNIVSGGGLEWLMWDVTKGMSINSALDEYSPDGWRLASNIEMATLFNTFQFGPYVFTSNETGVQETGAPWDAGESSNHNAFMDLFGHTAYFSCPTMLGTACIHQDDPYRFTSALFGSDLNGDSHFNLALVLDDISYIEDTSSVTKTSDHGAWLHHDFYKNKWTYSGSGVAFVRALHTPPANVPTPGSIGLFASGLFALGYRRRQVLGR